MRKMEEIREELGSAQRAYLEARATDAPESKSREFSNRVKALAKELSAAITEGAEVCEHCEQMPLGLRHVHATVRNGVVATSYVWEVGCTHCKDHRSLGPTREDAVLAWNKSVYLPPKA